VNDAAVVEIIIQTLMVTAKVASPILIVSLAVGSGVSVLQSITQVQEFTLTFVPKLAAIGLVLILSGNWMLAELTAFTRALFAMIPGLLA
jgi:flagellar biosynthesis protein FliQ